MKKLVFNNVGTPPVVACINEFGQVTIGNLELSCDDIQMIAQLAISERSARFAAEGEDNDE
jgi:hypothetical protein